MSTKPTYVFPGLWPFVERAGESRDLYQLGRARDLWHCKQVQDALGQVPRLDPDSRRELLDHVQKIRDSLAVAVEGIDLAVNEVVAAIDEPSAPSVRRSSSGKPARN